ncbi:MAG TPA: hypothetical protein VKO63_08620 [Chitinispirillaceae bacterium]|nr:hypothetical protein [Chitinispirillaceae bacterium]
MPYINSLYKVAIAYLLIIGSTLTFARNYDYKYFLDVNGSIHDRFATYDFGNNVEQNENRATMPTIGINVGRMVYLPLNFRISLPLHYEIGSAVEKTIKDVPLSDGTEKDTEKSSFLNSFGLSPELQYEFFRKPKVDLFCGAGFGLHYSVLKENEWLNNTRILDKPYLETYNTFCVSVCASAGFEFNLNKFIGLRLVYKFRYWNPVNGTMESDIFPYKGVTYKERFISNQLGIGIMVGR